MLNLVESPSISSTYSQAHKHKPPAIHISALPTRDNQIDLPSFTIPLQYNLDLKKVGDEIQFNVEPNTVETEQVNHWNDRSIPTFSLMNIKPLIDNSQTIEIPVDLKYDGEVKNENIINFDISTAGIQNTVIETENILGKVNTNEGRNIDTDFVLERYNHYHSNVTEKRYPEDGFHTSILDNSNKCEFVCDNEFVCRSGFEKDDELVNKPNQFQECNILLENNNSVANNNYNSNL